MTHLRGQHVTVVGVGLHGGALGTIEWLLDQGAHVTATDLKSEQELAATLKKLEGKDVKFVLGQHRLEDFTEADLIIRNPAVRRDSEFLRAAQDAGVPIEMDSSLFFEHSLTSNIIGITGSKGKTTTANAIYHVLKHGNTDTVVVGVDGVSPLQALPRITTNTQVVFELSSWRLEPLAEKKVSPHIAVVTSIYKEHLNTYESFEAYVETKKTIIRYQNEDDIAILNADDSELQMWEPEIQGQLYWYSLNELEEDGICVREGVIVVAVDGKTTEILSVEDLPTLYEHERRNMLPAILLGHLQGMAPDAIKAALTTLKRLPHRLEVVREIAGVRYVNDSAATMPDATIAALRSLEKESLVLIIGGSDKKLEFNQLAAALAEHLPKALVWLPGTATERMKQELKEAVKDIPTQDAATMKEAVTKARELAEAGDTVLLSPGATSFGLFQHEFDRGDQFRAAVEKL